MMYFPLTENSMHRFLLPYPYIKAPQRNTQKRASQQHQQSKAVARAAALSSLSHSHDGYHSLAIT